MKKIQLTALILIFLSIGVMLFAGGFALTGVGSRATSMGGAFRGLADDASAMYWNPAGLAYMEGNSVDLGGTFILPGSSWDNKGTIFDYNDNPVQTQPGYAAKVYEAEKKLRSFPSVFATMAMNPKLKFGLGIFVPYGLGTTWDAYTLPSKLPAAWGGSPLIYKDGFPQDEMMSSIAILDIHPSVAYQILPNLSAGLGISVLYGSIDLAKVSFSPDPNNPPTSANPLTYQYRFAPISSDLSGTGMGFSANIGMIFKPTDCMSLGLSGKLPATLPMEGEAEIYLWKPQSSTLPALKLGGKSDITTDLNVPGDIGLGISYKVMPNWSVNLDYSYTMWSTLDKVVIDLDTPIVFDPSTPSAKVTQSTIEFQWEDTNRISLGTEYLMGAHAFRAGFFMDESPIPEATQTPTLSDISTKYSTNLGYGRTFGKFTIDANVQYIMFPEREIKATDQTASNMAGTYNTTSMSGNIGIGYRF